MKSNGWKIVPALAAAVLLCLCPALPAGQSAKSSRRLKMDIDLKKLQKVDIDQIVRDGLKRGITKPDFIIAEADKQISRLKSEPEYSVMEVEYLAKPWALTRQFVTLMKEGKPLPDMKLFCHAMRSGVTSSGGCSVFKGKAQRAVEIIREIGLKDTANGQRWSKLWGVMDREVTPLGMDQAGNVIIGVDVVLGMNVWLESVFKQVYNVRDIERYCEYDLGEGRYVIVQDLVADNSAGAKPRAPKLRKRSKKAYYPVDEQISITVIRDNGNGTFSLANFMSCKGQPLKATTTGMSILACFVDLRKMMEKDTIKNRAKWNSIFQKEVLRPKRRR